MEAGFFLSGEFCMYNHLVVTDSKPGKARVKLTYLGKALNEISVPLSCDYTSEEICNINWEYM